MLKACYKKSAILIILLISILSFTACDPGHGKIYKEQFECVVEVQLISYDNPDQKVRNFNWGNAHIYDLVDLDLSKIEVIESLSNEKREEFADLMVGREYFLDYHDVDSPDGYCVRILYEDGSFMLISTPLGKSYFGKYDSSGKATYVFGDAPLRDVEINSFFNFQIPVSKPEGSIWDSLFE